MTPIQRAADAIRFEEVKSGSGTAPSASGMLDGGYSVGTRFEQQPRTNPEELLAACNTMASAGALKAGSSPA